jgi:hypothetical protein
VGQHGQQVRPEGIGRLAQGAHRRHPIPRHPADRREPLAEGALEIAVGKVQLRDFGSQRVRPVQLFPGAPICLPGAVSVPLGQRGRTPLAVGRLVSRRHGGPPLRHGAQAVGNAGGRPCPERHAEHGAARGGRPEDGERGAHLREDLRRPSEGRQRPLEPQQGRGVGRPRGQHRAIGVGGLGVVAPPLELERAGYRRILGGHHA